MPVSYGSRPQSLNPIYWMGWAIGAGAARVARQIRHSRHRNSTAYASERATWVWRAVISTFLVGAAWLLIEQRSIRQNTVLALSIAWVTVVLLPKPTPRIPLLMARLLAVIVTVGAIGTLVNYAAPRISKEWHDSLAYVGIVAWVSLGVWACLALRPGRRTSPQVSPERAQPGPDEWASVPNVSFAHAGGSDRVKEEIRLIAGNRFSKAPSAIVRNGVLLYGPQGTGKNLLAEATAGEYRVNFYHVRCPELLRQYSGTSSAEIRQAFEWASAHRPIVLFLDEIDSIGSRKQAPGSGNDPGGAGREYNLVTTQLMQSIDQYRAMDGLLIIAATNYLDGLEPTLIRDGRFDAKLRLDLPSEDDRRAILAAQLMSFSSNVRDLREIARRTPGWSPARLKSLVERAALEAKGHAVEEKHLVDALERTGGQDRPALEPVGWDDVVLPARVVDDLRALIDLMKPGRAEKLVLPVPTGLILTGAPGTGKTLTARLLASQSSRSFYALAPSDVLSGAIGGSVQKLREAFTRAKEHAPSILFFDEMDGLFPRLHSAMGQHDLQLVEQALIEISAIKPEHNVFLIGTTNYIDLVDPRILRGGRFSEKIEIGLPDDEGYRKLIGRYLGRSRLAPTLTTGKILERVRGISPADLEAVATVMKRAALRRMPAGANQLPPIEFADLEEALDRVRSSALT
jgi:transitional endoplasmic reticulum ATPase